MTALHSGSHLVKRASPHRNQLSMSKSSWQHRFLPHTIGFPTTLAPARTGLEGNPLIDTDTDRDRDRQHDTVRYSAIQCDTVRYSVTQYDTV